MKIVRTIIHLFPSSSFGGGISGLLLSIVIVRASIDLSYRKLWAEKKLEPAPISTDEEFLRRAYLDITGRIPTAEQTRAFLASRDPQKRQNLLATLVNSPQFDEYFASIWTALFLGYKNDQYVNRLQFQKWLQSKLRTTRDGTRLQPK